MLAILSIKMEESTIIVLKVNGLFRPWVCSPWLVRPGSFGPTRPNYISDGINRCINVPRTRKLSFYKLELSNYNNVLVFFFYCYYLTDKLNGNLSCRYLLIKEYIMSTMFDCKKVSHKDR